MDLFCSKCNAEIKHWNINIKTDLAKCDRCGEVHKASNLSGLTNNEQEEDSTISTDEESLSQLDREIMELARAGSKLKAVKHYHETEGKGLKESKLYVDELCKKHGIESTGACFVATVCYNDYEAFEVLILRDYRDNVLRNSSEGRTFIKLYYRFSPFFARAISKSEIAKRVIRNRLLNPLIKRII